MGSVVTATEGTSSYSFCGPCPRAGARCWSHGVALEARPESWDRWRGSPEMFHSTVTGSYPPAKSIVTVGSFDDDSQEATVASPKSSGLRSRATREKSPALVVADGKSRAFT